MTGHIADMPLLNKIIEFVLYEHPIDIEKLRRSLHHQVLLMLDCRGMVQVKTSVDIFFSMINK